MDAIANIMRQRELAHQILDLVDSSEGDTLTDTRADVLRQVAGDAIELAELVRALEEPRVADRDAPSR